MLKNKLKGKQRQSLRTSVSQKYSKAKPLLSRGRKPKSLVAATEEFSEPEEDSKFGDVDTVDEDSDRSSTSSPERIPSVRVPTITIPSIVPSTLSSTITKWVSRKGISQNDHDTRRLLGQLAAVVPLQGTSQYGKAHEEAVQGLTRSSRTASSSKSSNAKGKGKATVVSSVFKVSSIIFLPYGTNKGAPEHAGLVDAVREEDYTDIINVPKAPDEAYIQCLERQCLAVRNVIHGFELDTSWSYEDICYFLRLHFPFLFRYFKEGPDTACYATETPFIVVHKSHQTLTAVPYESSSLNGEVLRRNCMLQKKGFQALKLYFVTRHTIPLAVLMSWSRGEFITLPPSDGTACLKKRPQPARTKRKRAPSTPTTSDGEVVILEGGSIMEMRSPPRKRLTRARNALDNLERDKSHPMDDLSETSLKLPIILGCDETATDVTDPQVVPSGNSSDTTLLPEMDLTADGSDEHSSVWETYDPSRFGPDITATGFSSSSSASASASTSTGPGTASSSNTDTGNQRECTAPPVDFDIALYSSQQSFSDLNINLPHEDPYTASNIAFDF